MLLGEYEHTIDDKNRLTLPAKFRKAFEDGVVVTRGIDGCLFAYTPRRLGPPPSTRPSRRSTRSARRAGGCSATSSPARARRSRTSRAGSASRRAAHAREARPRRRRRRGQRPPRDLGPRRLAARARRGRRECGGCCRTSCSQARLTTSPSSRRGAEPRSAFSPARPSSTRPSARAAMRRSSPPTCSGSGKLIAIDRDPTARTYFERFAKRAGVQARLLRGDFGVVLPQLAENGVQADAILLDLGVSSMQLDRPERGFSYAVDAPLDMRMDPSQDLTAADVVNEWPEARARDDLPPLRRGAVRQADRARDRPPPAASSRSSARASSSTRSRARSRHRRASARGIRRSASSRLCGSPSTTSSARSRPRCRLCSRCCGRAAASP